MLAPNLDGSWPADPSRDGLERLDIPNPDPDELEGVALFRVGPARER